MKVSIVVYALNEVDSMRVIMPKIKKEWYDQLVIIDGGSKDGTFEWAQSQGYEIYRQQEPSWVGAYKEGFRRATGDILVDFSPDGNSMPEKIPELVEKIKEGYDLVIASRYKDGAKSEDDSLVTGFGNFLFTNLVNLCFGGNYTDVLVIFRAYRKEVIKDCGLDNLVMDTFTQLQTIRCAKFKKRTADIPADEPKRIAGFRKLRIIRDGWDNLVTVFRELIFYKVPVAEPSPR